jgi:AcrR family transcriptional regulator
MPDATTPTPRQRLIDAAADLFYRHGIGAVGVDLVSKAAGVSKRTLYLEFGSKDQLIAQTLDAKGTDIIGIYLPAEDSDAPPRQQILGVFDRLSSWTASESYRGCPFVNTATELADARHPARGVALDYKLRIRGFFEQQAARGLAADPRRLANQLIAFFDGALVQAVMGNALDPGAIQAAVDALLDAEDVR